MANTLSTVLFIEDVPVGYRITEENDHVQFTPSQFSSKACCPPDFEVTIEQDTYHFQPSIAEDVKAQAISTLEQLHAGKLLSNRQP